jgi:Uma2 family endonuclease
MTIATDNRPSVTEQQQLSLDEYLTYNDGTETRYELVNGELKAMSVGTGRHGRIAEYLNDTFEAEIKRLELPLTAQDMKIAVQSPRGGRWDTCRIPDITVLPIAQWDDIQHRANIIRLNKALPLNYTPPSLVIEVVSPSTERDDYRAKHTEYSVLNIEEYWIVDPEAEKVTICTLVEGRYEDVVVIGDEPLKSALFRELTLTATQVLLAK